jgi:nucleoside-diphosphate-sugar epimerase
VTDAAEALIRAATGSYDEQTTVMILAGNTSTTVAELAKQIIHISGKPGLVKFDRERDAGYSARFSTERMNRLIGDWNHVPLSVGLQAELEYFRGGLTRT